MCIYCYQSALNLLYTLSEVGDWCQELTWSWQIKNWKCGGLLILFFPPNYWHRFDNAIWNWVMFKMLEFQSQLFEDSFDTVGHGNMTQWLSGSLGVSGIHDSTDTQPSVMDNISFRVWKENSCISAVFPGWEKLSDSLIVTAFYPCVCFVCRRWEGRNHEIAMSGPQSVHCF